MDAVIAIAPLVRPIDAEVEVVGSKSYTNRALIIAALARGRSRLSNALFSDDTRYMVEGLRALGVAIQEDAPAGTLAVTGTDGRIPATTACCFVGNSGTTARFLPPVMALGAGVYEIDGVARMRERPIEPLVTALRALGVTIESLGQPDCIPLRIHGSSLEGGRVSIAGNASSQYLSGLMLAAPAMARGLAIDITGGLVSRGYPEMTAQAMRDFGARVERRPDGGYLVEPGPYLGRSYRIEPDASAASYFFAAAAIAGGRVRIAGLGTRSLQDDRGLVHLLARMGCEVREGDDFTEVARPPHSPLRGIEADMANLSDVAQTLAVVAPFASSPTRVTGVGFIRHKETDRVAAVVTELRRVGIRAEEEPDGFVIYPGAVQAADVETYDDHRMAMSFALLGLTRPGIRIKDPACVNKTFPSYFTVLATLGT